jgi:hypothetical protein
MFELGTRDQSTIMRIRVKSDKLEPHAAKLRLASLLSATQLHPSALPSSAIVFVRKLLDPLPGSLQLDGRHRSLTPAWQKQLETRLDLLARKAVRPAIATVPAMAEAVVFMDRAELLACLAADWCDGSAITRWWWQSLFPRTDARQLLIKAWIETPEHIPAALHQLAKRRDVQRIIHAIHTVEAQTLRQTLIRTFGLANLQTVFESSGPGPMTKQSPQAQTNSFHSDRKTFETLDVPFWKRWAPEASREDLTVEQTSFLAIGLMLYRAPAIVRSLAFARAVERWYAQASHQGVEETNPRWDKGAVVEKRDSVERPIMLESKTPAGAKTSEQGSERETNPVPPVHLSSSQQDFSRKAQDKIGSATKPATLPAREPPPTGQFIPGSVADAPYQIEAANSFVAGEVSTSFGGLFYLINVGLFLELYGDFTSPLRPGLTLPIWDFIALLGEQILGPTIKSDAVWCLLVQLAGRDERDSPGADFEPLDEWRMPVSWLKPFSGKGQWRWSVSGGRFRVWHPEGFCVLDLPSEVAPSSEQVQSELQGYEVAGELLRAGFEPLPSKYPPLERWLDWIVPYLRVRIARALGVAGDGVWPALLISHEARVLVTDTRLDVIFSLQRHPFELRVSGLDRDPGWVPAAGRYIAFHFE